jgi:hypothetical protein
LHLQISKIFRKIRAKNKARAKEEAMPNYSKLEQELLSAEQRALTENSRGTALGQMDDGGLSGLIADLEAALGQAGPRGENGQVTAADLLTNAARRAKAERRRRKTASQDAGGKPAEDLAAKPKPPAKSAKRKPASPARKPAGREKAEHRKADLRTGSRRVAKAGAKPAAPAHSDPAPQAAAMAVTVKPVAPVVPVPPPLTVDAAVPPKSKDKAVRKAAKEAEKVARKAARKAEKDAVKAAEKAERKAARQATKAARKAEDAKAGKDKPKGKGKGKARASEPSENA